MDTGILTDTLNQFLTVAQQYYDVLHVWAMRLFYVLVSLDIVIAVLFPMIKGQNWTPNLVRRLIVILFLFTFISNYDYWVNLVVNGGIAAGIKASTGQDLGAGGAAQDVLNVLKSPSQIMDVPGRVLAAMWDDMSIFDVGEAIMLVIIGLLMFLSFSIVALTVIVTYLEFTFAATLSLILLPFAALKPTSFIGEKVFSLVVSYSVRLMVLAFIIGVGHQVFNQIGTDIYNNYFGWQQGLSFLLAGILYLMLAMSIPKMAAGLFSGSPSLGAGDAATAAGGAVLAGAGLAMGGLAGANGAMLMASKSSAAATTAGGFAKGAYQAGKAGASGGSFGGQASFAVPISGLRGAVEGMKGVGRATGRAALDTASSIKKKFTEPSRNRFETARLSGTLASKEAPARSARTMTAGESFSAKQNNNGFTVRRTLQNGGQTAGRGVYLASSSSQSPITSDGTKHIKDDEQ